MPAATKAYNASEVPAALTSYLQQHTQNREPTAVCVAAAAMYVLLLALLIIKSSSANFIDLCIC